VRQLPAAGTPLPIAGQCRLWCAPGASDPRAGVPGPGAAAVVAVAAAHPGGGKPNRIGEP